MPAFFHSQLVQLAILSKMILFRVTLLSSFWTFAWPHKLTRALVSSFVQPTIAFSNNLASTCTGERLLNDVSSRDCKRESTSIQIETTYQSELVSNRFESSFVRSTFGVNVTNAHWCRLNAHWRCSVNVPLMMTRWKEVQIKPTDSICHSYYT